ncbi:putative leucine-rich repeat-containing protein DDB_G0290503 isoform X2 [Toxorhynchites rutilus septentrionalis]|uniref:putative leucine-rich repeat-containing protein DDB_G0290503 isoform X2 n=1 Tax=Toxorhynchites rutilus septentrionalis TaxID=329112 RepID=UPI0024799026|nr:putative leucine-rich repeat-containing protein DDB_G0290503 isoform X2 [Toxorhynchites rutilus septentrionalis]
MSISLPNRLHRKILDHISLKNRQLRSFSRYLLDADFIYFAEIVEEAELHLETLIEHTEVNSSNKLLLQLLGRKLRSISRAKDCCIRKLQHFVELQENFQDSQFQTVFFKRLSRAVTALQGSYVSFVREIEDLIQQIPEIYEIAQLQSLLEQTNFLYLIVVKNHENIRNVVQPDTLKSYCAYKTTSLELHARIIFKNLLIQHLSFIESMEPINTSHESLRDKLTEEITRSRNEIVIQEEELAELRQELFPSEISLKEQRDAVIDQLEMKELSLEHRFRSIDQLQTNIHGLEAQVAQLIQERERVHDELMAKRDALRAGIREIVRLEKLIEQIEREISNRLFEFQEKLEELEQKRLAILADETLTEEERERLLAELEQEIGLIRQKHDADLQLLKDKCEELKALSISITEDLDTFRDELMRKHQDEIRELEEMMKNATPSELEIIKAKITALKEEFDENLAMLDRAKARPKFYEDEFGRYYIDETGRKVYQRESGASEYILTEDGQWKKIKDALEILTDEKGDFYIDNFGRKIYVRKYFEDEFGKYYLDSNGKRIYLEPELEAEELDEEEIGEESKSSEETISESVTEASDEISMSASELRLAEKIKEKRASDVKYVQDTVGLPLRSGLALTYLAQPDDPIEFLADYLEKYDREQKAEAARVELLADLKRKREESKIVAAEDSVDDIC